MPSTKAVPSYNVTDNQPKSVFARRMSKILKTLAICKSDTFTRTPSSQDEDVDKPNLDDRHIAVCSGQKEKQCRTLNFIITDKCIINIDDMEYMII